MYSLLKSPLTLTKIEFLDKSKKKISLLIRISVFKSYFQKTFVIYQGGGWSLLKIVQNFDQSWPAIKEINATRQPCVLFWWFCQLPDRYSVLVIVCSYEEIVQFDVNSITKVKQILLALFLRQNEVVFDFLTKSRDYIEVDLMQSIQRNLFIWVITGSF